jgi:hypothetical protein
MDNLNLYYAQYKLFIKEFDEILHYTQYSKEHLGVYSVKNMNLIVRIGQSVENLSKVVEKLIYGSESYHCLDSFDNLSKVFMLEKKHIVLNHPLQSRTKNIPFLLNPFKKLKYPKLKKDGSQKVDGVGNFMFEHKTKWYKAYTDIKHNPTDGLNLATLENLANAFSAYYILYLLLNFSGSDKFFQFKNPNEESGEIISRDFLDKFLTSCFLPKFWVEENNDLINSKRDECLFLIVRPEKRFHNNFGDLNFEENLTKLKNSINAIDIMELDNPILKQFANVGWVNSHIKAILTIQNTLRWVIKLNNLNSKSPEIKESKIRQKIKNNLSILLSPKRQQEPNHVPK